MAGLTDKKIVELPTFADERGLLTVAELSKYVPFPVKRLFFVRHVPVGVTRGGHGHHHCRQYLICQNGRMQVEMTDGRTSRVFHLCAGQSVLIEAGIFATETYLTPDALLLVLCDRPYEKSDYIDTVEELIRVRSDVSYGASLQADNDKLV